MRNGDETFLRSLIGSGQIGDAAMTIELDRNALASALGVKPGAIAAATITLAAPFQIRRRGVETRIIAGEPESAPDKILIRRLAEAHRCVGRLRTGVPLSDLARDAGHSGSYLRTRMQLAFLSPRIQAAILEGAQPPDLTLERIVRAGVPLDWSEQERLFGFKA